jgi:hypothetical protein
MDNTHRVLCDILAGQDLASSVPWEELLETASAQGVAPLLAWILQQMGWPDPIPSDVQTHLKAAWRASAVRSMLMSHRLLEVIETLSRPPAIPVVLLKGAALGPTLYPESSVRPMCDLDLLVPEDRVHDAVMRLKTHGYCDNNHHMVPGLDQLISHNVPLTSAEPHAPLIELHWTLGRGRADRHAPDMAWFWGQTEPFDPALLGGPARSRPPDGDATALILTPTAHLLFLAAHLMLHHGAAQASLRWLYDIHLMVEREGSAIDWEELVRRASQFHWATALAAALQTAHDRFGTAPPEGVLDALSHADNGQAAWLVRRRASPLQTRATSLVAKVASLDWPARLRLVQATLLPSPAFVRWRYHPNPPWLWPLCYPYRWADIAREAATTLWRLAGERRSKGARERRGRGAGEHGSGGAGVRRRKGAGGDRETK